MTHDAEEEEIGRGGVGLELEGEEAAEAPEDGKDKGPF